MRLQIRIFEFDNKKKGDTFSLPIDLIRVFAIALVMVLHASNEYYTAVYQTSFDSSAFWLTATSYKSLALPCVPLFVMLSGALLLQPSKVDEPISVFLRKRFSRIGLAYLFWSVVYLAWGFFVTQVPVTLSNIAEGLVRGLFTGPYYHFWFLYLIAGLYLITPILRTVIAYGDPKILRYLIVLWFLGVAVVPILQLIVGYGLYSSVFVLGGWIGYFVLGVYLQKMQVRSSVLYVLLFLGLVWTVVGTWFMTFIFSPLGQSYFFLDYLTANVIVASVCLFLILSRFPADWPGTNHSHASRVVHAVSKNVLPIYLLHVIILESLQKGYFGFRLSLTTLNPIVGVPVIAVVVFFVTFGLVLLLKRVPVLKKLIG